MLHIAIEARPRAAGQTKGDRKRMRREGHVLGSVYGKGMDSIPVTVEARDLVRVLSAESGVNTLIDLSLGGKRHLVRLADMDHDPITRSLRHVGLHTIVANEAQKATVPVEIVGEPAAVTSGDGVLELSAQVIDIKALPENMVSSLLLDVSEMQIDDSKHASDLPLPKGFELVSAPDTLLAALRTKRDLAMPEEPEKADDAEAAPAADGASS